MAHKKNGHQGFTLAEILIVSIVVFIFASVVVPRMVGFAKRSAGAEAIQMMTAIRGAAEKVYSMTKNYPIADIASTAGVAAPIRGNWETIGLQNFGASAKYNTSYYSDGSFYEVAISNSNGSIYFGDDGGGESFECNGIFKYDSTGRCTI